MVLFLRLCPPGCAPTWSAWTYGAANVPPCTTASSRHVHTCPTTPPSQSVGLPDSLPAAIRERKTAWLELSEASTTLIDGYLGHKVHPTVDAFLWSLLLNSLAAVPLSEKGTLRVHLCPNCRIGAILQMVVDVAQ
ncbi:unnamed protein product [Citrullus colocynthis]|uniref:Uncharacterized protein n=1 Tax=Citrullus colocynthis TaxID=252529 RepID=A0ABP0YZH0_9ROSI